MKFSNPNFLYALFLVVIPIIIHLFNFRRYKKFIFPNIQFLKEVEQKTSSVKNLKHLWVLISRIIFLSALVFVFAGPYWENNESGLNKGDKKVSIFIDNSFSMDLLGKEGNLIEIAKNKASTIVKSYNPGDRFQILTHDMTGSMQRLLSRDEALDQIDKIQVSSKTHYFSEILNRQKSALENDPEKKAVYFQIGDFQKTFFDWESNTDSAIDLRIIPLKSNDLNNLVLDSVYLESPFVKSGSNVELKIRVKNFAKQEIENASINLFINGVQKGIQNFSINSGSEEWLSLFFIADKEGWLDCRLEINDESVKFDNSLFFTLFVKPQMQVMVINGNLSSNFPSQAFATDSFFKVSNVDIKQINYGEINNHSFIVLNGPEEIGTALGDELVKFVQRGGDLCIFPPASSELNSSWKSFLANFNLAISNSSENKEKIAEIDLENPLFDGILEKKSNDIALPELFRIFNDNPSSRKGIILMKTLSGKPFLEEINDFEGKLYLYYSALNPDWNSFGKHGLFLPTLFSMAFNSEKQSKSYYYLGTDDNAKISLSQKGEQAIKLRKAEKEWIPGFNYRSNELWLDFSEGPDEVGIFEVSNASDSILSKIAFNYNRAESNPELASAEELSEILGVKVLDVKNDQVLKSEILSLEEGIPLWKWFLILSLAGLVSEILILRFWK